MDWQAIILAVIGFVGTALSGGGVYMLLKAKDERRKLCAEAERIEEETRELATKADLQRLREIIDTQASRMKAQDEKIQRHELRIEAQAARITALEVENARLHHILIDHNISWECAQ